MHSITDYHNLILTKFLTRIPKLLFDCMHAINGECEGINVENFDKRL